jgi:hypothetical protein
MTYKGTDFNADFAVTISQDDFVKLHTGILPDTDLAEAYNACFAEKGIKPKKAAKEVEQPTN